MKLSLHTIVMTLWVLAPLQLFSATTAGLGEDYNQWKEALGTNSATAAEDISAPPGFVVELVRSAETNEGSWVAMTFDPRGRIVIAREDRGLLRVTLSNESLHVQTINTNLLECRGLLFAYDALYANANNSKGLYRLRDTDGDEQFDEIKLLKRTPGGVGHGRNQLALGPDGMIYSIHGDDVGLPAEGVASSSPLRNYAEDRLLPCDWDKHLFNANASMPYGHLIRTDREGTVWELVAGGLRNPFGIDFNEAGDLFTFEADMEWDVGLPWYHPTRVLHLVPGGDYGWRRGTGVLPVWSPDTLPSAADVGLGSPTAVKFGTKSNFPEPWRSALYILDWAYGAIHAIHLERPSAAYTGRSEVFLKGRPLNVTGLDFGPDGAMYFVTGGRRTQSGLYRVKWTGERRDNKKRQARPTTTDIWKDLNSAEHWMRYRARVALEQLPLEQWRTKALNETRPTAGLTALLALARNTNDSRILDRVHGLASNTLAPDQQLIALRAVAVFFARYGKPEAAIRKQFTTLWEQHYPTDDPRVNQAACEMLVYLQSSNVVSRTLPLLERAMTQEEKLHYLFTLRSAKSGWTLEQRRTYFNWLARARKEFRGANMLSTVLNYIRADAENSLTPDERTELADAFAALDKTPSHVASETITRPFVKNWTMADFTADLRSRRDFDRKRGQRVFTEAGCALCHRVGTEGGVIGPDLTAVAARFDRRALFESLLEPSRVIADVYRNVTISTRSGAIFDGRIVGEDSTSIMLAINPVDPDQRRRIAKNEIVSQRVSDISPMPEGLMNSFTREEILNLIAWMENPSE